MATDRNKKNLFESFADRRMAVLLGLCCWVYLSLMYLPETGKWMAKILPLWPLTVFGGFAAAALLFQAAVWKIFRHYYAQWYLNPLAVLLFICEFSLMLFTLLFFSWPFYGIYHYLTAPRAGF